jgi:Flp pilus assembly protein TadD
MADPEPPKSAGTVRLPLDIVPMMEKVGWFQFDPTHSGVDADEIYLPIIAPLHRLAQAAPGPFLEALRDAVLPGGGWAVYGAARTVMEVLAGDYDHPAYHDLLRASLEFLRERGVPATMLNGYEWDFWLANNGRGPLSAGDEIGPGREPWLVGRPKPTIDEAPITGLQQNELRRVAQVSPEPDSNVILVKRADGGDSYVAVIDARYSDEDPTRSQADWQRAGTLDQLYWAIGTSFQVPTHWYHAELEPYFPFPRPRLGQPASVAPRQRPPSDPGTAGMAPYRAVNSLVDVDAADWRERAQHFLHTDNPQAAHRVAQEAVRVAPGDATAWSLRGESSARLGNYADAEYELGEAARLDPTDPHPLHMMGEVYGSQERWDHALAKFDEALALAPQDSDILASQANSYLATGQADRAVRVLEPVVSRFPDTTVYAESLASAYFDATIGKLTPLPDGRHICTEEHHLATLWAGARKIERLRVRNSPEVFDLARKLRDGADDAQRLEWDLNAPNGYLWLGGILFVMMCGMCGSATNSLGAGIVLGLLIGGGAAFALFAKMRRKPAWKINKEQYRNGNLTQQAMGVANRAGVLVGRLLSR